MHFENEDINGNLGTNSFVNKYKKTPANGGQADR